MDAYQAERSPKSFKTRQAWSKQGLSQWNEIQYHFMTSHDRYICWPSKLISMHIITPSVNHPSLQDTYSIYSNCMSFKFLTTLWLYPPVHRKKSSCTHHRWISEAKGKSSIIIWRQTLEASVWSLNYPKYFFPFCAVECIIKMSRCWQSRVLSWKLWYFEMKC